MNFQSLPKASDSEVLFKETYRVMKLSLVIKKVCWLNKSYLLKQTKGIILG